MDFPMKKGSKSLLMGAHAFWVHPALVTVAWVKLYGSMPSLKELFCIFIHDWGYWGCENIDDEKGEEHPEWAAKVASRLFGAEYGDLARYHSRHYAKRCGAEPSKLCWADKLGVALEPWWFYIPKACITGEIAEYREMSDKAGFIKKSESHRVWYKWIQQRFQSIAANHSSQVVVDSRDIV
jgi:hypothetical protein